jgi:hypothetical protein
MERRENRKENRRGIRPGRPRTATRDDLFRALGSSSLAVHDLADRLQVTAPTVRRLISEAGESVCRMGRGPATRYARTRTVASLGCQLPIYEVDETGSIAVYGSVTLLSEGHWVERQKGGGLLFRGLPPFLVDMAPSGYIGRGFPERHSDVGLPRRIRDWSDDNRITAVARRGEDCAGSLIVGSESYSRFFTRGLPSVKPADYPDLAREATESPIGSSAAGEWPKFAVFSEGRHVLVKFAVGDPQSPPSQRSRDLLLCEHIALERVAAAGIQAALSRCLNLDTDRYLEVERFDRVQERGRISTVSLDAFNREYLGEYEGWTRCGRVLERNGFIDSEDSRRIRWLDCFADLIGNTDAHLGNLSFLVAVHGMSYPFFLTGL